MSGSLNKISSYINKLTFIIYLIFHLNLIGVWMRIPIKKTYAQCCYLAWSGEKSYKTLSADRR